MYGFQFHRGSWGVVDQVSLERRTRNGNGRGSIHRKTRAKTGGTPFPIRTRPDRVGIMDRSRFTAGRDALLIARLPANKRGGRTSGVHTPVIEHASTPRDSLVIHDRETFRNGEQFYSTKNFE